MIVAFLREIFGRHRGTSPELSPEVHREFGKVREATHHLSNEAANLRASVRLGTVELASAALRVAKRQDHEH